jgi:hypothetical protein
VNSIAFKSVKSRENGQEMRDGRKWKGVSLKRFGASRRFMTRGFGEDYANRG